MDFILSYNNNEGTMVFPVIPNAGIPLSREQANVEFDGINGQLQALGMMALAEFELSSIFPTKVYPWSRPWSWADGWRYVETIKAVRARRIPFRAIQLDNSGREVFNLPVSIDSFSYCLDKAGDIAYTIKFREYRFAAEETALSGQTDGAEGKAGTPVQTSAQAAAADGGGYIKRYTANDATMIARVMFCEARGIASKTEIACVGWTILNRVDAEYASTIYGVVTAKNQFAYRASASTTSDHGYSLITLATDVLDRWSKEKSGQSGVGRVLPKDYLWYAGDGTHNYFRNQYKGGVRWTYTLPSPYES